MSQPGSVSRIQFRFLAWDETFYQESVDFLEEVKHGRKQRNPLEPFPVALPGLQMVQGRANIELPCYVVVVVRHLDSLLNVLIVYTFDRIDLLKRKDINVLSTF